jgi:hypothetical protein
MDLLRPARRDSGGGNMQLSPTMHKKLLLRMYMQLSLLTLSYLDLQQKHLIELEAIDRAQPKQTIRALK